MFAKLKADYFLDSTTACGGLEFKKDMLTMVPAHEEDSARNNPALDIVELVAEEPALEAIEVPAHEEDSNVRAPTPTELLMNKRSKK